MIVQYKMVSRVQYSHVFSRSFPQCDLLTDWQEPACRRSIWGTWRWGRGDEIRLGSSESPTGVSFFFQFFQVYVRISGAPELEKDRAENAENMDHDLRQILTWRWPGSGSLSWVSEHHWQIHQLSTGRWPDDPTPTGSGDHLLFEARAEKTFMRGFSRDHLRSASPVRRCTKGIRLHMCRNVQN